MRRFFAHRDPGQPHVLFAFQTRSYPWRPHTVQALWRAEPTFRRLVSQCDAIIQPLLGWSVEHELTRSSDLTRFHDTEYLSDPTLAAVSIAQVELWRARGLEPDGVMGMSNGEVLAAFAAGVLTLEDTLRVMCAFSRFVKTRRFGMGAQVLADLDWEQSVRLSQTLPAEVSPTVEWSPTQTVFAGETRAVEKLVAYLEQSHIAYRRMQTQFIFHAPGGACDPAEWAEVLPDLAPRPPKIPFYSALTGGLMPKARFDADHWWTNIFSPAYGVRALRQALAAGYTHILEIGMTGKPFYPIRAIASAAGMHAEVAPSLAYLMENQKPFARPTLSEQVLNLMKRKLPVPRV